MSQSNANSLKFPGVTIIRFFASFKLAATLFLLLLLLTLLGTLAQRKAGDSLEHGLVSLAAVDLSAYDAAKRYFSSWYIGDQSGDLGEIFRIKVGESDGEPKFFDLIVPFPGGLPLMSLLFLNILCGGILRLRLKPRTIGVVIAHSSMLFLLVAAFVAEYHSFEGNLYVEEGKKSNVMRFFFHHDLVVTKKSGEDAEQQSVVIPDERFRDITKKSKAIRNFRGGDILPFDLMVSEYESNAAVQPNLSGGNTGYEIQGKKREIQSEANRPALRVKVLDKSGTTIKEGILWYGIVGMELDHDGEIWDINIDLRAHQLPFVVQVDDFIKEDYPNSTRPKRYESKITKITGDGESAKEEKMRIYMNHPLREDGYAVFQAGFRPQPNDPPGTPVASIFQIANNPSDNWPLIACILVGAGMLIHFLMNLNRFISRQNRQAKK